MVRLTMSMPSGECCMADMPTWVASTVSPVKSRAKSASDLLNPCAMRMPMACWVKPCTWENDCVYWNMVMSRPGYFSQIFQVVSAQLRRNSGQGSSSSSMIVPISAAAWVRHASTSASRLSKSRYMADVAIPSLAATAPNVNRSIPNSTAALITSSLVNRGFGPVFRPARRIRVLLMSLL